MREHAKRRLTSAFHAFSVGVVIGAVACNIVTSFLGNNDLQTTMLVGIGTGIGVAVWSTFRETDF